MAAVTITQSANNADSGNMSSSGVTQGQPWVATADATSLQFTFYVGVFTGATTITARLGNTSDLTSYIAQVTGIPITGTGPVTVTFPSVSITNGNSYFFGMRNLTTVYFKFRYATTNPYSGGDVKYGAAGSWNCVNTSTNSDMQFIITQIQGGGIFEAGSLSQLMLPRSAMWQ